MVKAVKKGSIFADIMLGNNFLSSIGHRRVKSYKQSKYSADRHVKICPDCKRAWEQIRQSSTSLDRVVFYYKNMPKFGKPFKLCNKCKDLR